MPTTSSPRIRLATGLLAGGLLLGPLTACSFSSDSVSCSGTSCSVTLKGDGAKAKVLGYELALAGTDGNRASLKVGDRSVSCTSGQSVDAGPLRLECSSVTDESVQLRASLG
jgi:hypothetical protein